MLCVSKQVSDRACDVCFKVLVVFFCILWHLNLDSKSPYTSGSKFGGPSEPKAGSLVKTYVGHTRFATSSIASFDGTHPHQWTPPRLWRCYDLSRKSEGRGQSQAGSTPTLVENFITHNGDFDFYELNGMSYGLDGVQSWLERVSSYNSCSMDNVEWYIYSCMHRMLVK